MKRRTRKIKRIYRKDPSRTSQLRGDMVQHLKLRFKILKQKIVDLITKEDALGLIQNSNPEGCNQYTGKDCQGTSSKEQEPKQSKEPSQQSLGKIKEKLQHTIEKLKKAGAKAKEIEHAVVSYTKDKINKTVEKLPAPMQKVVNATVIAGRVATKTAFVTWVSGQALAEQIAKEKGKTEEEAKKLRSTLEALDIVAYKPVQIGLAVGLGPTAALTSFIPPATCIYLAYSTARNPLATAKAAKNLVKSLIQRFKKPKQQPPTTNSSKAQIEALEAALNEQGYSDWYIALLIEAYQQTEDLQEAITLAKEALTISPKNTTEEELVANIRWAAQTNPQKLIAFKQWVAQQIGLILTSQNEKELWKRYAEEGLKKGIGRAFNDTKKIRKHKKRNRQELSFTEQDRGEFLQSSFNQPVSTQRVQMLATRSFDDLENVTDDMETKLHRSLMDGLVQGSSPREIAADLVDQVGLSEDRALTIARTEIIRAHADGQLLALKELGIENVGVAVEWSTTGDEKVCKACEPLEGVVMKLEEAEGLLPRHPNCRCAWIPANVGEEDTEEQITTKAGIEQRLEESETELGDSWAPTIDRKRPVSIFNSTYIPEVVCLDEENN